MSQTTPIRDCILSTLHARFWFHLWREYIITMTCHYPDLYSTQHSFISPAAFHIFNRLCNNLILLALAYAKYYPDQHFTYTKLLKMVQHIMVHQRILLLGNFKENREEKSKVGYDLDFDPTPLIPDDETPYRLCT